jgi:hypothetical protein
VINTPPIIPKAPTKDPEKELLSAAQICWLYALLPAIPIAFILTVGDFRRLDPIGAKIISALAVYSVLLVLSGTLLYKRNKAGFYLGILLMVIMVIQIPIGTVAGFLLGSKLNNPDVKALLK